MNIKSLLLMVTCLFLIHFTLNVLSQQTNPVWNDGLRKGTIRFANIKKCLHDLNNKETQWYKYDPCIEPFSQNHANYMATNNKFEHSTNSYQQKTCGYGFGENISAGRSNVLGSLQQFYDEVKNVGDWNKPCDSSKGVVGHFSSLIWKDANRFAIAGAYNKDSTYKYYWSQNMGSGNNGSAPNTSSRCTIDMVPPISKTHSQQSCERDVYNYYNNDPSLYWVNGKVVTTNQPILSQIKINNNNGPITIQPGKEYTITWNYNGPTTPTFTIRFCDNGITDGTCSTLQSGIANNLRSTKVTIPSSATVGNQYGFIAIATSIGEEMAGLGGLTIARSDGGGDDGGVTPVPEPTITYSWDTTQWSTCTPITSGGVCGTGSQTRQVICKSSNGSTTSDDKCTGTKPTIVQKCTLPNTCQNNGQCNDNTNRCQCPDGYSGDLCEKKDADTVPTITISNEKIVLRDDPSTSLKTLDIGRDIYKVQWSYRSSTTKLQQPITFEVIFKPTSNTEQITLPSITTSTASGIQSIDFAAPDLSQNGGGTGGKMTIRALYNNNVIQTAEISPITLYYYAYRYSAWNPTDEACAALICGNDPIQQTRQIYCYRTVLTPNAIEKVVPGASTSGVELLPKFEQCDNTNAGSNKEDIKKECFSQKKECQNGGQCISNQCKCPTGFFGETCQSSTPTPTPIPTPPEPKPCTLICSDPNTSVTTGVPNSECTACICNQGYFGPKCICREAYITLPFSSLPDYFTAGLTSDNYIKNTTPSQRNNIDRYFTTISKVVTKLLKNIDESRVSIVSWHVFSERRGKLKLNVTFAIKSQCGVELNKRLESAQQLKNQQQQREHQHQPLSYTPDYHGNINDISNQQQLQNQHQFQTLQQDNIDPVITDTDVEVDGLSTLNDMTDIYTAMQELLNDINNPSDETKDIINTIPTNDQNSQAIEPNPNTTTFSNAVYDPNCDSSKNAQCETIQKNNPFVPSTDTTDIDNKKENLTWLWILIGVLCGVLIVSMILAVIVLACLNKCCWQTPNDKTPSTVPQNAQQLEMQQARNSDSAHLDLT